jgi:hypothetical protein
MYSINVFVTFSLSNLGMSRFWVKNRKEHKDWFKHLPIHLIGLTMCVTILIVTSVVKFAVGGWLTLLVTKRHYGRVVTAIRQLDTELPDPLEDPLSTPKPSVANLSASASAPAHKTIDPTKPVAVIFVGGYGGLGRHALLTLLRMFPGHFQGIVFCSVAVIDSGVFKGIGEVHELERRTKTALSKYVQYADWLELPAESTFGTGIEVAVVAEKIATDLVQKYPKALFVAGQLIFDEETFVTRALHNETAFTIQRRLQHAGVPMIVLPVRLNLNKEGPRLSAPSMTEERAA